MSATVLFWSVLAILAWGWFGYAAKRSTTFFSRFEDGSRYTQIYQPFGYVLIAGGWGLIASDFRPNFHPIGFAYAIGAGLLVGVGLHFFTKAISSQEISIVAPLTAMYPILTMFLGFIIAPSVLTHWQLLGLTIAIPSIWLLNGQIRNIHQLDFDNGWFKYSLLTILCWGVFALLPKLALDYLTHADVAVYQAIGYFTGGTLLGLVQVKGRVKFDKMGVYYAIACGLGSGSAGIFYLFAVGQGNIALVAPLTSLYPIVTVMLGRIFLKESIAQKRKLGIVFSIASILLMSV